MTDESPRGDALTQAIVDHLGTCHAPETTMSVALALRVPYPIVLDELESLETLGIVVRDPDDRSPTWWLG